MKSLKEALITKKNINRVNTISDNKYGITKKDMIDCIKGFPVGVVVRMMEEQEKQGNKPDITVFQELIDTDKYHGAFNWRETEEGHIFWENILLGKDFDKFYKRYPKYKKI